MAKQIRFNAFDMNTVGHLSPGLWRHPRDRSADYKRLSYWTDLARLLERGKVDGLFIADVLGVYDVFGGTPDAALGSAAQIPINDPMMLVSAMAAVTKNLGFGITANLSYEHPYVFARRMTTLDHLTDGRIGWNIVTGYLDSAAKGAGLDRQRAHDDRYDLAEEYLEVVYKLWEGSWEEGAVVRDHARGLFVDPARVHRVQHAGEFYRVDAIHLGEPSPQRTPVLYQAGTSSKGRVFAGRHAECVFVSGPSVAVIGPRVADLRRLTAAAARAPNDMLIFALATVVVGETEAAARAKYDEYRSYADTRGGLALMSGWTGVDFSTLDLDQQVRHVESDASRTALDNITRADPSRVWTVRDVVDQLSIGGIGPVFVGTASSVADQLEAWVDSTDVDGFNLAYAVTPESFVDVVDHVVPELQRRGRYKRDYVPGPLREKLFGSGRARLSGGHPGAAYRIASTKIAAE